MSEKTKRIIPYIIAVLCAGFACTQEVSMLVINWMSSLLMKLNYGWFTALLIVLLIIWCCYQLWVNWRKYKYGDVFIAALVFFVVTTLYYRFFCDYFDFVLLVWKIAYVDVLCVLALLFIGEAVVNKIARKNLYLEGECAILFDSPIETPNEDQFDYYSEALHIATTLSQLPKGKAVSVAVLSPWGNGKTSFVNLIKYAIRHGNDGKSMFAHIIVEFNPRQSKDIASIQEDFFKALTESIPDEAQIRKKISDYLENIGIQDVHPIAKIFTKVLSGTKKEATDEVNEALNNLGKRLVIFIDDFDRLTDVEIIEALKLIDKNAAFRNTIFITAYDEKAVSNALRKYEGANGIAYIDKFFTLRFHLPLRSDVSIVNAMYQFLRKKIAVDIDLLPIMNKRFWIVADCVRNLRDVKSFYNMFQIDYAFNSKHEINFEEYFLLELMKFRYYDDYCCLFKKEYIENGGLFQVHNADATYTLKQAYSSDQKENEPKREQPRSINILRCIFNNHKSWDDFGGDTQKPAFRSVQYVRYFEMYFTNRSYGHVHAESLESLYTMKSDEEIDKFYRQCIQQKAQSDIVDFLRYHNWQDITPKGGLSKTETFKQFVRLVFLYSAITDGNDTYIHALQLQLIYNGNFEKGYNGMEEVAYHNYLLEIIYNHVIDYIPLAFLMRITHTLIAPVEDGVEDVDKFLLKGGEVKHKNLELFKEYIAKQQQYSTRLSEIYRLCLERVENNRLIITKEANDIMREFLCKDSSNEYLNGFLVFNKDNDRYISMAFKDPFFKQIFPFSEGEDLFAEYVKKALPENDENKTEILAYLERYRKAGSDHSGYYYVKSDYPCPTNIEIIKGLQF
jgi:hypothetical protein